MLSSHLLDKNYLRRFFAFFLADLFDLLGADLLEADLLGVDLRFAAGLRLEDDLRFAAFLDRFLVAIKKSRINLLFYS